MDGLRWLLLAFGLAVICGVYFYGRNDRKKSANASPDLGPDREEPVDNVAPDPAVDISMDSTSDIATDDVRIAPSFGPDPDEPAEEAAPQEQRITTLRVVAGNNGSFLGETLMLGLRNVGMRHGKFGIFHHYDAGDEDKIVFSAASLVEPGSFDMDNILAQKIPGISLFMVLPGVLGGPQAFDLMVAAGRGLAESLHAELLDESGSSLSIQRERYLREEIIQYQHGIVATLVQASPVTDP